MKVNDFIKTYDYKRNVLSHFDIVLYSNCYSYVADFSPNADEYIYLCDRDVTEWYIEDGIFENDNPRIKLCVVVEPTDYECFADHIHIDPLC